jgi:bifunctional N-acetylglucosamine-1-phosphate-uridyltransferase/glucosamine-1-phosphate-acetyltransferase GlmU-like protein
MPLVTSEELEKFTKINADIVMSVIKLENPDGYGRVVICRRYSDFCCSSKAFTIGHSTLSI